MYLGHWVKESCYYYYHPLLLFTHVIHQGGVDGVGKKLLFAGGYFVYHALDVLAFLLTSTLLLAPLILAWEGKHEMVRI